ncbi:MAG TPA: hypothetical protein ENN43_07140 [bacterium]|nr:hypothetical protein [bacterium]
MIFLIDGYNLMHQLDLKAKELEGKREEIAALVTEFLSINSGTAVLVFDGHSNPSQHRGRELKGKITVVFSARGETADDVLMEMMKKRKGRARDHLLITNDRRLKEFAAEESVRVMDATEFAGYFE